MNQDAIPEILYPNPKKPKRYVVLFTNEVGHESFESALKWAELCARDDPDESFAICRIDSTVELISGVISVRSET